MKLMRPEKADQKAEIQPDQRQADGVINPENEAERALPTHETGNGLVHVAGDLAHRVHVIARYPAVDLVDHPVPVKQQVKGDDGGDHQERHDIDQRFPGIPYLRQQCADETRTFGEEFREVLLYRVDLAAHPIRQEIGIGAGDQLLQRRDILRDARDEFRGLGGNERNDDDERQREDQHEGDENDDCGHQPAEAAPLQPIGHRIEKIG